jgi:hypothetical protein
MKAPSKTSIAVSNIRLRQAAANALTEKGFEIEEQTGKGIRPGARLMAKPPDGPAQRVAVRTGAQRSFGFSRDSNGNFRTLDRVDIVLAVAPDEHRAGGFEVFAFESETLKGLYAQALKELEKVGRSPELDLPIFIPLDEQPKKNLGHHIANLKARALWSVCIGAEELPAQQPGELETFIDRVKREFAEKNEVDVSKVSVEFRILS